MTSTNVSSEKTVIDPRFDIPEGLSDFVYSDDTEVLEDPNAPGPKDIVEVFTGEPSADESDLGDISHDAPAVPMQFTILSQKIRMSPDGRQIVDIEAEVEDIPGVVQIDVRTTKA